MAKLPKYFHFRVLYGKAEIGMQDVSDHDFVEVVRCKDCKHGQGAKMDFWNEYEGIECIGGVVHRKNWFCADGERKDGDGDV